MGGQYPDPGSSEAAQEDLMSANVSWWESLGTQQLRPTPYVHLPTLDGAHRRHGQSERTLIIWAWRGDITNEIHPRGGSPFAAAALQLAFRCHNPHLLKRPDRVDPAISKGVG